MKITDDDNSFTGIFDSLSNMVQGDTVALAPLDSSNTNLDILIDDHIYGLLSLDEISTGQVALLDALLNARKR